MTDTETNTGLRQARYQITNRTSNDNSAILQLPVELVLQIIEHLGIIDKAILSRTCASFRIFLDTDWAPISREWWAYEKVWLRIVHDMPNHWFCHSCHKIEPINQRYVPHKQWTPSCQRNNRRASLRTLDPYQMRSVHAQMALKLSRLGNINNAYFKKIMAPFSIYRRALKGSCLRHYRAVPKIVDGNFLH